jgi:perosamine synthetase
MTASPSNELVAADFIPLCVPEIRGNEWKYIKECLDTNWVSSVGSYVDRFEGMVAESVATALLVAGVQPDDEVLVSTLTFVVPANAIGRSMSMESTSSLSRAYTPRTVIFWSV